MKSLINAAYFITLLSALLLYGCAKNPVAEAESTEQAYYLKAKQELDQSSWARAVETLEELESRYPFGRYAEQAQLDLIYARFRSYDYEGALAAADRFIRLHPQHDQLDYVYYLRGLSSYNLDKGFLDNFLPVDKTQRDPGAARESINDFSILLERYPDSEYAEDARARVVYLRNALAAYEIHVARFYLKRKSFVAAINRGREVVEQYQQTPSVADGLAVMITGYYELGMNDLAQDSLRVLQLNYPDHDSLRKDGTFAFEISRRSWLNVATFGLLGKSADQLEY